MIIQVLALYMSFLYGLMYLVLSTFPGLWEGPYNESIGIGGLNYISMLLLSTHLNLHFLSPPAGHFDPPIQLQALVFPDFP